ncbi:MAG TPA: HD domain-containing protein [Candidatus Obscuribacterales bacterium]
MTQILKDALERIINSPEAKELYKQADIMSAALTKHGEPHALGVMDFGLRLAQEIEAYFPGTFTQEEMDFSIPAACYSHDIGRSHANDIIDGKPKDRHEIWGSRIFKRLMNSAAIPLVNQEPVCYAIVNHRANGVLGRNALDPKADAASNPRHDIKRRTLAITVLADKCVGDAERVRTRDALKIQILRTLGLSRWYFFNNADEDEKNDFANYSIKHAELVVDPNDNDDDRRYKGAIILRLDMDEKVCGMAEVFSVKWFREAYHCCGKSANVLGFVFRIEANGQSWHFDKQSDSWQKRIAIPVPRRD